MSRILHLASGLLALLAANVAAAAITLSPLAGSTPQTAHPLANFGVPIGVTATDDTGAPIAGLPVTFQMPSPGFFVVNIGNFVTVTTDANGVARIPDPGVTASTVLGTFTWPAVAPGATSASFILTVAGTVPAQVAVVSGDQQVAQAGATLPQPFVAQVTDSTGAPIPFPIVFFSAGSSEVTAGTFNGATNAVVVGDASGVAIAPPFVVNTVLGSGFVSALTEAGLNNPVTDAFFLFTIAPPPPPPITLSAVTGSTPQSTRMLSFFPVPLAVKATHPDGSPVANVTVTFTSDPSVVQVPGYSGNPSFDVVTGADGIAMASSPLSPSGFISFATGSTSVTASSAAATNQVQFALTVSGGSATRMEILSGSGQSARPGGDFAPLVARVSDDSGPVPYAAVQFLSSQPGGAGDPVVTFNGSTLLYVPADAQGIVKSPVAVAGSVAGAPLVSAGAVTSATALLSTQINYSLSIVNGDPGYGLLRPWQVPPLSVPVGSATTVPFAMQALDSSGNPVANAPVIFTTDPSCGTFAGSRTVTATADASGIATAPPFTGTHASVSCATSARALGQSRDLTMHVFDPSRLQATVSPSHVIVHYTDENFGLSLSFAEHGHPVHFSQIGVSVLPHPGASFAESIVDVFDTSAFIGFAPSQQRAAYVVQVTIAGQRYLVPVVQMP